MLKSVKLQTDSFIYQGQHQEGYGRSGTVLDFQVLLEPTVKGHGSREDGMHWVAAIRITNDEVGPTAPISRKGCLAEAVGSNPLMALEKLASNLRRAAEAIDHALDTGITVPVVLHRRKVEPEPEPEPDPGSPSETVTLGEPAGTINITSEEG